MDATSALGPAVTLFAVVATLLTVFLLAITILIALRRRRLLRERREKVRHQKPVDPWVEAGKRMKV